MSVSPLFARRRRWTASPRSDVALALVLGVVCLQRAFGADGLERPAWAVVLLIELSVLPLAVRRSHPLAVLATTLAAAIVGDLWFAGLLLPGPVIALYTVGAHCERRIALATAGATGGALVIPAVAGKGVSSAGVAVAMYAVFAVAWALGDNLRTRRAYLVEVEARPERLERLVAEDNEVNQKLTLLVLEKMGYRADVAVNGLEALEASAGQEMRDTDVLDDSALEHLDVATGDPAFVADLVDTFLREAPVLVAGLKTARQSGDAEEVRRAAHKMKSNARTFGAAGRANLCQELENTAKRHVMSEPAGLVTNIQDESARVASALATAREERRRA